MRKKLLITVVVLMLVLTMCTLVACGNKDDTTKPDGGTSGGDSSGGSSSGGGTGELTKEPNLTSKIDLVTNVAQHKANYDKLVEGYNYGKVFLGSIDDAIKETQAGGSLEGLEVSSYGIEEQIDEIKNGQFIWKQYQNKDGSISNFLVPIEDIIYLNTTPTASAIAYYNELYAVDYIADGNYLIDPWNSELTYSCIDNNTELVNGLRLSADKKLLINASNASGDVVVPDTVMEIKKYAIRSNDAITSLTFGEGIKALKSYSIMRCNNLVKVTLPNSVEKVAPRSVYQCKKLESINIPRDLIDLESNTFYDCPSVKEVRFDPNAKTEVIRQKFIFNIKSMPVCVENIVIPKSVITIENCAFDNWIYLKTFSVEKGSKLKYLGLGVQYGPEYKNLTNYSLDRIFNVDYESDYFDIYWLNLETLDLSNATELVGLPNYLCADCRMIKEVMLPSHIKEFPNDMFFACGMTEYVVPQQITRLGRGCFDCCQFLTKVTLHKDVQFIGQYAFNTCNKLTDVVFEGTMAEWEAIEKEDYIFGNNYIVKQITCSDGVVPIQ